MKNELGIEVKCENCLDSQKFCRDNEAKCSSFIASVEAYKQRIKELQEQRFTKEEAEKIETFLTHGYQMMINKNKEIFSKLERMKGEQ